ncbi:MAG: hypothetical protein HGA44_19185, partial [Cellulomonadaceae bacterium]|nr:hypothetical protein [Cellulomonadaceae bacterium]
AVAALLAQAVAHAGPGLTRAVDVVDRGVLVLSPAGLRDELSVLMAGVLPHWLREHAAAELDLSSDGEQLHARQRIVGSCDPALSSSVRSRHAAGVALDGALPLVVPWRSTLVCVGAGWSPAQSARLATLARLSGSRVVVAAPDALPIVAPQMVHPERSADLAHLLALVKHADTVIAFGGASARAYRGLACGLTAQGLPGPDVRELPVVGGPPIDVLTPAQPGRPRVTIVGADPRTRASVAEALLALRAQGRGCEVVTVDPGAVSSAFEQTTAANVTGVGPARQILVALDPGGTGLLLDAALRRGVPAVVCAVGVPGEVAANGGCVPVDPDDDAAVASAIAALLDDDVVHAAHAAEAAARPASTWRETADALWDAVTRTREVAL